MSPQDLEITLRVDDQASAKLNEMVEGFMVTARRQIVTYVLAELTDRGFVIADGNMGHHSPDPEELSTALDEILAAMGKKDKTE